MKERCFGILGFDLSDFCFGELSRDGESHPGDYGDDDGCELEGWKVLERRGGELAKADGPRAKEGSDLQRGR